MFEGIITNIKRRFSKTSSEKHENVPKDNPVLKRSSHNLKVKCSNPHLQEYPQNIYHNTALSPRASGIAECAETEVEWPILIDNYPNILDKFTNITNLTEQSFNTKVIFLYTTI